MALQIQAPVPNRLSTAILVGKSSLLQLRRAARNALDGTHQHPQYSAPQFAHTTAKSETPLWTDTNPSEAWYQRGKIQNLRVAAGRLHLCVIPPDEVFSFWKQVGRASALKGYVRGRMLQEGCMIPAIGGGLCQLSNALYQVALDAGCEILERHPHSRIVPGSATAAGRDATVAWNYIDLRFRSSRPIQLRVVLTATELHVSIHMTELSSDAEHPEKRASTALKVPPIHGDHACESCGNTSCFRHAPATINLGLRSRSAFLLDAAWPEFKSYVATHHNPEDILAVPLHGERWNRPQFSWPSEGFSSVHTATLTTLAQALRNRSLPAQGASRQSILLKRASSLARQLAKSLNPDVDEVYVSQSILPSLWQSGVLGGRRIRVFMSQLPMVTLQSTLDEALRHHPKSPTLGDFRADPGLMYAEEEALRHADHLITPHAYIAALFQTKTTLLEWSIPPTLSAAPTPSANSRPTILFPASTLGRKGAYELREALRGLSIKLLLRAGS